jgi:hypothetical protein
MSITQHPFQGLFQCMQTLSESLLIFNQLDTNAINSVFPLVQYFFHNSPSKTYNLLANGGAWRLNG